MRLFIAINIDEETRNKILDVQDYLRHAGSGNLVAADNLHLTLAFLGEVECERLDDVKAVIDKMHVPDLELKFNDVGFFNSGRTKESQLWWIGIEHNDKLVELQKNLVKELKAAGFHVDDRRFKPHITIIREMHLDKWDKHLIMPRKFSMHADHMSLMFSERKNGQVVYKELGSETLKESVPESGFAGQAPKGTCRYAFETPDGVSKALYKKTKAEENNSQIYPITRISGDIDWSSIPVIPIDKVLWTEDHGILAQGQICYDDEHLYIHQSAVEEDVRAVHTEPLSPVYEDSCLEFFFKLDGTSRYFNFEINPNGCLCIQLGPNNTDRINIVRNDAEEYFDIHTNRTKDGWEVYYRIPLEFIRFFYTDQRFKGGLSANMYKCGNKTKNKHFLSWADIGLDKPNFHCPEYFGRMVFD